MSTYELEVACQLETDLVIDAVVELARVELIELEGDARLARLGRVAQDSVCESLMKLYEEDRSFVLSTLLTISMRRIRNMAARAFSEAFVIRKRRGDTDG
jgi:lipase chaperone LimK